MGQIGLESYIEQQLHPDGVLVTLSEFGRTAAENGSRGTDHGHANAIFVIGGPVQGGKVLGEWPGLDRVFPGHSVGQGGLEGLFR